VTIAETTKSDSEVTPDVINETWAERGFGWRMVRLRAERRLLSEQR
jgi:hypothetical protein